MKILLLALVLQGCVTTEPDFSELRPRCEKGYIMVPDAKLKRLVIARDNWGRVIPCWVKEPSEYEELSR